MELGALVVLLTILAALFVRSVFPNSVSATNIHKGFLPDYHCCLVIVTQDISSPYMLTDSVREFADGENTDFETVFVLTDFDSPDYDYLYKRDHRIIGPSVVLYCAAKEEVSQLFTSRA